MKSPKNEVEKAARKAKMVVVAANKGGAGKSTVCQHLSELAFESGLRVLAVETDSQGDLPALLFPAGFKEWTGEDVLFERDNRLWLLYSPAGVPDPSEFEGRFDLIVVDTAPKSRPDMTYADCVVVPIDGPMAIKDCAETIYAALQAQVALKIVVPNKVDAGGVQLARALVTGIKKNPHVKVTQEVPFSPAVARSADTGEPAWNEQWGKNHNCPEGASKLRGACESILSEVMHGA